jgi:putative ABC transport system substrate-binding protein
MKRREFILTLGGAAATAAWPLATWAQQGDRMRAYSSKRIARIAVLMAVFSKNDPLAQAFLAALDDGLRKMGWVDGENIQMLSHFVSPGHSLQQATGELIKSSPDIIVAVTTPAVAAVQRETGTIPIIFVAVSDPIGSGFVTSLARPGGNITGFTNLEASMAGKWLGLLKEIAPSTAEAALIFNPETAPGGGSYFSDPFQVAAPAFSVRPISLPVRNAAEMQAAVTELGRTPNAGLIVPLDVFFVANRDLIVGLASQHSLPAIYPASYYAKSGGLISYGASTIDLFRRATAYIDRILRGEKPHDLPVQNPIKFELVINLKTAKALGLDVPPTLLPRADELIE